MQAAAHTQISFVVKLATLLQNSMHSVSVRAYEVHTGTHIHTRPKCVQNDALHLEIKQNCTAKHQIGSLNTTQYTRFIFIRSVCSSIRLILSTECTLSVILFLLYDLWVCVFVCLLLVSYWYCGGCSAAADVYFTVSLYFAFILFNWYSECLVVFFAFFVRKNCLHLSRLHHFTSNSASLFLVCSSFWLHKSIYIF